MPIDDAEKRDAESGCGEKEMPRLELCDEREPYERGEVHPRGMKGESRF